MPWLLARTTRVPCTEACKGVVISPSRMDHALLTVKPPETAGSAAGCGLLGLLEQADSKATRPKAQPAAAFFSQG
jgi:hypothetical protein